MTFGELVARGEDGLCALTFDDGFESCSALADLGVPATLFVTTGWLGGRHPDVADATMLSEDGVRRLHAAGVEIGAHTATHPDLTTLGFDAARDELASARLTLESLLEAPVTSAAYPYGRATAETVRACGAAGFTRGLPDERVRLALERRSTTRARTWTARRRCSGCGSRRRGATSR